MIISCHEHPSRPPPETHYVTDDSLRNRSIKVQCDASQQALGAALMQYDHVVAFASRSLTETEKNYMHTSKKSYWLWFSRSKSLINMFMDSV